MSELASVCVCVCAGNRMYPLDRTWVLSIYGSVILIQYIIYMLGVHDGNTIFYFIWVMERIRMTSVSTRIGRKEATKKVQIRRTFFFTPQRPSCLTYTLILVNCLCKFMSF